MEKWDKDKLQAGIMERMSKQISTFNLKPGANSLNPEVNQPTSARGGKVENTEEIRKLKEEL